MGRDRKKKQRGPLTPKRKPTPVSFEHITAILHFLAPQVEAAGSYQRAKELSLFDMGGFNESQILALIPKSKGGTLEGPEVEADWRNLVEDILRSKGQTLDEIKRGIEQLTLDSANHQSKPHTAVHVDMETGERQVLHADNTADALRLAIAQALKEYQLEDRVEYNVQALEGPWVRLDIRYIGEWDVNDFSGFPTDVEKAMQGLPHGYYEVRERDQNQDGTHLWFVARHEYGPLI